MCSSARKVRKPGIVQKGVVCPDVIRFHPLKFLVRNIFTKTIYDKDHFSREKGMLRETYAVSTLICYIIYFVSYIVKIDYNCYIHFVYVMF